MVINRKLILVFILAFSYSNFAQFKLNQTSSDFESLTDSLFLETTDTRTVRSLNNDWKAFFEEEPDNYSAVSLPTNFTSKDPIVFESEFNISSTDIINHFIKLNFLGLNYTAEIFINNSGVYKHPGGVIPFSIDLSENILNIDEPNTLRIKIQYNIDSENTIPLLQRFLFPKDVGGILRDVFLSFRPKVGIENFEYDIQPDKRPYVNRINFNVGFENFRQIIADSLLSNNDGRFKLEALLTKTNDTSKVYFNIWNINPLSRDNYTKDFYVRLRKLEEWSNNSPTSYIISLKLTNGDGFVYDELRETITLLDIDKRNKKLYLNGKEFSVKGVTYIRGSNQNSYEQIENDIKLIKESGFNTIRFSKVFPHPYAVHLCKTYGLFALIELPLNSVPESFTEDNNFNDRATSFLKRAINYFDNNNSVIGYGAGGAYLSSSQSHKNFLSRIGSVIKEYSNNKLSYASFLNFDEQSNVELDLFGVEIYSSDPANLVSKIPFEVNSDSLIYFISEATYPTYQGATNGYLNNYSFEGQAKFFDDVISMSTETSLEGFILNTMFDYDGDYTPMYSGYNEESVYNIGILGQDGNNSRISYNLIKSRLLTGNKITVPIGSKNDDGPLFFIIAALIISIIIALLINSKRKFREDATRALLRPYNFFADIRDQRILSGFHSSILMFLLAGSNALLITILLYFLKNNLLIDKLVSSFGSYNFSNYVSHLAWHPEKAFVYIYGATIVIFILVSFLVHLSSFFVKTRVLYSSVYSVAIWAFLPLALLLPLEAILYKILLTNSFNYIIYGILVFSLIWNIQRFLKGIYVIFDVRPLFIYSYAFLILAVLIVGLGLYFQYTVSAYDYITLAIKQYILL